jgi:SAM-dependent methyltransferase
MSHEQRIQDQFTRQSSTFGSVPSHSAEESLALLIEVARPKPSDRVLDIACGPGIVTTAFAAHAAHVTGLDVVPAMIERARARAVESGVGNVTFEIGDSNALPYPDESFDLVVTRYSFHHLTDPVTTLREIRRVCRRGGTIVVADVAPPPGKDGAYDALEKIRDPSHTHALPEAEFEAVFAEAGLAITERRRYGLPMPLEAQLAASFPEPGGVERLRQLVRADIGVDALGVQARVVDGAMHLTIPILVLRSVRAA